MKQRAQLTFSSWNKVRAFGKPDATHLAQVHHFFVCARPEPLDDDVDVGPVLLRVFRLAGDRDITRGRLVLHGKRGAFLRHRLMGGISIQGGSAELMAPRVSWR